MSESAQTLHHSSRVVLFTTPERPADIPGETNVLACLLPLGTATFIERVMDSCTLAGVREIDIVVSEQPEDLRRILQDGEPWGIRLNWHHAKDTASPYKVLRGMGLDAADRVLIGHANQWVASRIVGELLRTNGAALNLGCDLVWAGWFSLEGDQVSELSPHDDFASLTLRVRNMVQGRCVIATSIECAQVQCAQDLLQAQKHALDGSQESSIPASWRRFPWGAASPDAVIHAGARIEGPVLIGPGSVVEDRAELGPGTLLVRDVFVAEGARVRNSLVMPNTYVGGQITLDNALAQGNSIQNLKWSVRTVLCAADALVTPLRPLITNQTPGFSRAMAGVVATLMLPPFVLCALAQRLQGGARLWDSVIVVKARLEGDNSLDWVTVRLACGHRALDRAVAHYGALLDIIQGRRSWFGLRPRRESEWYTLGRDWQKLFGRTAIGLLHAPAWTENNESLDNEAYAAADAFMAVQTTLAGRIRAVYAPLFRWNMRWNV